MATMMTSHSYTLVDGRSSPGTPSHSPPYRDGNKMQVSPANSDDSSIACDLSDLSFNYERVATGEFVRVSKGSSKSPSPPTPDDSPPRAPSPILPPALYSRPAPLARSESLPQESMYSQRQFQRAASGPSAITPAGMSRGFTALATGNAGTARKIGGPRRVRLEDLPEAEHQLKPTGQVSVGLGMDEKENQRATRIIRPARSLIKPLAAERISEVRDEVEPPAPTPYVATTHHAIRPRRSASLSEAPPPTDPLPERPMVHLRPGTSLGARRVTLEEKIRQEREIAKEEGYANARREQEEAAARAQVQQQRQGYSPAPSPPHLVVPQSRHQRRESDTMRTGASSPTVVEANRQRRSAPVEAYKQAQWDNDEMNQPPLLSSRSTSQVQQQGQAQKYPTIAVNKRTYMKLDSIGKGGSSRVFRVMTERTYEQYALKRVNLEKADQETLAGYMNEIALLKRLDGNKRIIRLFDSELKPAGNHGKAFLMLLMEIGEIDFARLLAEQQKEPMDPVWVAYYWKQMLQAVHVIHEEKIVHSDLKPANFVLVRGQLKLIDFGIANAIANDTTNIQRDHQVGTVNYMSPEAITLPEGMRRLKVGRPSDVWSLGCILYQMVYGQAPFNAYLPLVRMQLIPDENHVIEYPEYAVPYVRKSKDPSLSPSPPKALEHLRVRVPPAIISTLKRCLIRQPKLRATIPELLQMNWLDPEPSFAPAPAAPAAPVPTKSDRPLELQLGDQETIINAHYMKQLLLYGMKQGTDPANSNREFDDAKLEADAERLVNELKKINVDQVLSLMSQGHIP